MTVFSIVLSCNTILEMAISEQKCRFIDSLTSTMSYSRIFLRLLRFTSIELPVMEFQDQGYKIRKIFAKKSTFPKETTEF